MFNLILDAVLKNSKIRDTVVRLSFFTLNGILAGIFMNDLTRIFIGEIPNKHIYEYLISGGVGASGLVLPIFGKPINNLMLGAGMVIGTFWADITEESNSISLLGGHPTP